MIISELGYLKIINDNKPKYIVVPQSHIVSGVFNIKENNAGYEPSYIVNLAKSFSVKLNRIEYYPRYNIMGYHGPLELELYEGKNYVGDTYVRLNSIVISDPNLIDFDMNLEDYTQWERAQEVERLEVFGP